jgi:elongation factor P hydroxylase
MSRVLSTELESVFNTTFAPWNTQLLGNAPEPVYLPADQDSASHRLFYREDYSASALHEIAHWCIAGDKRREQVDFGYWYRPEGRTLAQQRTFEQVEVKPQALEWIFATACGLKFTISADNLSADEPEARRPSAAFAMAVAAQARSYCSNGLPERAVLFVAALSRQFNTTALQADLYPEHAVLPR